MKNVIVIGAGIAGLAAGIYAQKSGFKVTIYESHSIPGGNCTSWRRKGYLFEGGMHWLTGSSPDTSLNKIWRETGAIRETSKITNHDPFIVTEYEGERIPLYRDAEKMRSCLLKMSPEDAGAINRLYRDIRRLVPVSMPIMDVPGLKVKEKSPPAWKALFKMLPALPLLSALGKISVADYAARFKHPAIRYLLQSVVPSEGNATALLFTLACFASGDGGYVEGGSLKMADNMAKRFTDLGGVINYGKKVTRVAVKNNAACGVFVTGEEISADAVLVASDTLMAVDALFDPPFAEPWALDMRRNTSLSVCTFVSLGIETDLSDIPESLGFSLKEPFDYAGERITDLGIHHYAAYSGYAPAGCTGMTMILMGDTYDYWKSMKEQGRYESAKKELFETLQNRLEAQFPQIKGKIAVWDIATPLTYERYCGTYHGSWMTKTPPGSKQIVYPYKSKTVRNLYFAGQRVMPPGGMPTAVYTGRTAAQHLCKDFNAVFTAP